MALNNATVAEQLESTFSQMVIRTWEHRGMLSVSVPRARIVAVAGYLRDTPGLRYVYLENLCGVDYLGRDPRFEVVYHLLSLEGRHRLALKVGVPEEDPTLPTLTDLWPTANWQEREAYDMFGLVFTGHPALHRILMPDDWEGYPQRKDVPLGYEEVAFTHNQDAIYARKPFAKE
jgi:NADH-quinone oxidoreductase subunit C